MIDAGEPLNTLNKGNAHMAKKQKERAHPDDLMVVTVSLEFQAKIDPQDSGAPQFEATSVELCLPAAEAAEYVQEVLDAIKGRRLYGFMVQELATSAVEAGQWIKKPLEELRAEASNSDSSMPRVPHLGSIKVR
jgi:hypothetical protein